MDDFRKYLDQQLKNPEFTAEWNALEPEYQIIKAIIAAREEKKITQKELSAKTGITQADISRLENGEANPSLKTLKRVAEALGKKLHIEFIDARAARMRLTQIPSAPNQRGPCR